MVMLLVSVIALAIASMGIGLPIVVLTNTDSDGTSSQKYSLFFCATFRKSGDNNSHVRRSILCDVNYSEKSNLGRMIIRTRELYIAFCSTHDVIKIAKFANTLRSAHTMRLVPATSRRD